MAVADTTLLAELAAMRAIKHALDPLNQLNPGRVFDRNHATETTHA